MGCDDCDDRVQLPMHERRLRTRSWTVLHEIDTSSPLHGARPEDLKIWEAELRVMVVGLDDTSMQTVHASHNYYARDILWGFKHADVLTEKSDGSLVLDLRKFHTVEPTQPTDTFPYPEGRG